MWRSCLREIEIRVGSTRDESLADTCRSRQQGRKTQGTSLVEDDADSLSFDFEELSAQAEPLSTRLRVLLCPDIEGE